VTRVRGSAMRVGDGREVRASVIVGLRYGVCERE
jgi:hypothetical protein